MQTLQNRLQEIKYDFTEEQCNSCFKEIAQLLFNNYAAQNGEKIFRITDIEFYFYGPKINDERTNQPNRHITYERTTPAGYWSFHDSGVDLSFESDKDKGYGGGILIRGIKQIEPKEKKAISGCLNTYWELFEEYVSAFKSVAPNPHLIPFDFESHPDIQNGFRVRLSKIEKTSRMWRYSIKCN